MKTVITVTVETDGRRASWKEIENRNAAIGEMADRNLGKFLWAGSGKGIMDFAFEVHDEKAARALVARVLFQHLPGWKYGVESTPAKLTNMFRMHVAGERRRDWPRNDFEQHIGLGM